MTCQQRKPVRKASWRQGLEEESKRQAGATLLGLLAYNEEGSRSHLAEMSIRSFLRCKNDRINVTRQESVEVL